MESTSSAGARRRADLAEQGRTAYAAAVRLVRPGSAGTQDLYELGNGPAADLRTLDAQLAILSGLARERLRDARHELDRAEVVELSQILHDLHTVRFAIHDHLGHERIRRLDQLDRGLSRLRRVTDQDQLLELACEAAATSGGFERVMLSRVEDDTWRPWHSYSATMGSAERSFLRWIREVPTIHLSRMLLESDLVRQREAAIVIDADSDPRVYAPMAQASGLRSYVAAPIIAGDRVIGLLHADNRGAEVVELDRDILWFFAIGFAQIFERAVLLARLRDQRAEVVEVMKQLEAVLGELATSEIDLASRAETSAVAAGRAVRPAVADQSAALERILTARELEVLALMATGATNERIAQQLVIATGTVKSHVKQILRKLRAENRAVAISQYLRLTIGARED